MTDTVRLFSFGGGVQSTAVLVLQAQGRLPRPYDAFVFANVGQDSENPDTLAYVERYARPFARSHGIRFVEVQKVRRNGQPDTLVGHLYRTQRSVPIPARMGNGAPGRRSCTVSFKIRVVDRWVRAGGYRAAVVGLGISLDEFHRLRDEAWHDHDGRRPLGFRRRREHPLIDLRLGRDDCRRVIAGAGLPVPPKSSCFFCPFRKRAEWIELRRDRPRLFARAVAIEQHVNQKRGTLGRDRVYLHPDLRPLEQAVGNQLPLPLFDTFFDTCDSGYCFT